MRNARCCQKDFVFFFQAVNPVNFTIKVSYHGEVNFFVILSV